MPRYQHRRSGAFVAAVITLVIAVLIFAGVFIAHMIKEESEAASQEAALRESILQQSLAEQEKTAVHAEYIYKINEFSEKVKQEAIVAADICYMTMNVWSDTIYQQYNEDTVAYTQTNGVFHSDYNESIDKLYASADISNKRSDVALNVIAVSELYQSLKYPPEGLEECFLKAKELYSAYMDLADLTIVHYGTLSEYSEAYLGHFRHVLEYIDELTLLTPRS